MQMESEIKGAKDWNTNKLSLNYISQLSLEKFIDETDWEKMLSSWANWGFSFKTQTME